MVMPVDAVWSWLCDPSDDVLPAGIRLGTRVAEFITVDALSNHLEHLGMGLEAYSWTRLIEWRDVVAATFGEVIIVGRRTSTWWPEPGVPSGVDDRPHEPGSRLGLRLPPGEVLPVRPFIGHRDHGFDWGIQGSGTVRTARAVVRLAWSDLPGRRADAIAHELAVAILADVVGGFELAANSVADWIATEAKLGIRPLSS